ncbi:hypothetical protein CL633_02315 [bacterium]|nr:hypothetical protein [bacterium]|tara:strand:- start:90 stop:269 length:180 start_codon:yes stop_codon:yes gene_type:complete
MKNKKHNCRCHSKPGSLFIPAGVLLGLGIGFLTGNIPAGLFIGIGAGFALFGVSILVKK